MTIGLEFSPFPSPVSTLAELRSLMAARRVTYFRIAKSRTGWVWSTEFLEDDQPRGYYSTGHVSILEAMLDFCAYLKGGWGGTPQGCVAAGQPGSSSTVSSADASCAR